MITTLNPFLVEGSNALKEQSTDTSAQRISYGNTALRALLSEYKFAWSRKTHDLALSNGVSTYDLSSVISDFNPSWGLYEVQLGGETVDPIDYDARNGTFNVIKWYFHPDNKSMTIKKEIDGTENIDIIYYAQHMDVEAEDTALNISYPESVQEAVGKYIKYLVHDGRRQRNDARNTMLDYRAKIDALRPMEASNKARLRGKTFPNVMQYARVKRSYARH